MTQRGGERLGGQLTPDRVLQALAALGTPAVLVADEPTRADFLELLGCLVASTEAALMGMDPAELAVVRDGYRAQIGNADDGVLRLLSARLDLLALQLAAHPSAAVGDVGAVHAAGQAAMAANGLVGVHLLTRPDQTGRPALLRDFLREVKQHIGNTRRGFDRVADTLRGRGV